MRLFAAFLFIVSALPAQQILRVPTGGPPLSLDPHLYMDLGHVRFFAQIFEAPLELGLDKKGRVKLLPAVTSLPEVSKDGLTITLTMQPGIRFADDACFKGGKGRRVTAKDVVYSLRRHADPSIRSAYWQSFLQGRFKGLDAWRKAAEDHGVADHDAVVPGLRAEKNKVILELTAPYPQLISLLSQPWASIVAPEAIARYGSGFGENPVGTGPFRFAGKDPLGTVRLRKNPNYRMKDRPLLDEVRFEVVKETEKTIARFFGGDLHILDLWSETESHIVGPRGKLKSKLRRQGIELAVGAPLQVVYLAISFKHKFLKIKKVRQAITLALDRRRVLRQVLSGRGMMADSPVPPAFPEAAVIARRPYQFKKRDIARAKELLAEAGFPGGKGLPEFILDALEVAKSPSTRRAAEGMIRDLAKVGIRVQLRSTDYNTFRARAARGNMQLAWLSWYADYPDVENFLGLFRSTPEGNAFSYNYGFYKNEEFDKLYDKFAKMYPGPRRTMIVEQLVDIVREDCPWIFLGWQRNAQAIQKGVSGYRYNVLNHSLRDVSLETDKPKR